MTPKPATSNSNVTFTRHFREQMASKGFRGQDIANALREPYKITPVTRYPGQWRFCGSGVAVVARVEGSDFILITVYADGIVTPLRPDQMSDPEALNSRRVGIR
jgi:hypothetical protein